MMLRAWRTQLASLLHTGRDGLTIALACGVGLLVGVAAIAFHELLHLVQRIALGSDSPLSALPGLAWYWKVGLPALGGALVAPIVYKWVG